MFSGAGLYWENVLLAQTPEQLVTRQADALPWLAQQLAGYTRGWMDIAEETTANLSRSACDRHDEHAHHVATHCTLPYVALKSLCRESSAMLDRLHRLMGDLFNQEAAQMMVLGSLTAEERVAAFQLDVSSRNWQRGYSQAEFHLRMSREDMGSYLGITLESVSRIVSRFQKRGLIDAQGKLIRIVDIEGLQTV